MKDQNTVCHAFNLQRKRKRGYARERDNSKDRRRVGWRYPAAALPMIGLNIDVGNAVHHLKKGNVVTGSGHGRRAQTVRQRGLEHSVQVAEFVLGDVDFDLTGGIQHKQAIPVGRESEKEALVRAYSYSFFRRQYYNFGFIHAQPHVYRVSELGAVG